jgi:hypothetical protein
LLAQVSYDSNELGSQTNTAVGEFGPCVGSLSNVRSPGDSPCLFDDYNLIVGLDRGQGRFDLAPHPLPVLVLVVTVVQIALRIVTIAIRVVEDDITIDFQNVLVAQDDLARLIHVLLHGRVHVQPGIRWHGVKRTRRGRMRPRRCRARLPGSRRSA